MQQKAAPEVENAAGAIYGPPPDAGSPISARVIDSDPLGPQWINLVYSSYLLGYDREIDIIPRLSNFKLPIDLMELNYTNFMKNQFK